MDADKTSPQQYGVSLPISYSLKCQLNAENWFNPLKNS